MCDPVFMKQTALIKQSYGHYLNSKITSVVARAFPGGRAAHPKDQIEEENEEKLKEKWEKIRKEWGKMRKCSTPAQPRLRVWLRLWNLPQLNGLSESFGNYYSGCDHQVRFTTIHSE